MKIVFASSEAVPFAKTGGLADVVTGLGKALVARGHEVTLILPYYRQLIPQELSRQPTSRFVEVPLRGRMVRAGLVQSRLPGTKIQVLMIDHPGFFDRPGVYVDRGTDYPDNCERFCFFSRCVLETARVCKLLPDILHLNDWQTGLASALLQIEYRSKPGFEQTAAVFTIHNMAFQGSFWSIDMELTGLDWSHFNWRQMEHYGQLNLLKTGIVFSDAVTTVSPTYAQEIQTPEFGCGLEGVLQHRKSSLRGILNGIDVEIWNPASDPHLPVSYDVETVTEGKAACKRALQQACGLSVREDVAVLGMISRMTSQKGFDLITKIADPLLTADVQLVFLGTGDPRYERFVQDLRERHPGQVHDRIGFDEGLAHLIEAGSDLFLMPSQFEPCGLNQMYSQRYGTVPVVHAVGGLADSVVDDTPESRAQGTATGFQFSEYTPEALLARLREALAVYRDRSAWQQLVRAGMMADWSWNHSARQYEEVYHQAQTATARPADVPRTLRRQVPTDNA